jgi:HPt (histidine-containing phosphotransfer) domain-containing protein
MSFTPDTSESPVAGNGPGVCEHVALDLAKLLERCMGDLALAAKLLKRFHERLPKTILEIDRTLEYEDYDQAQKRVHALKGEAASLAAYCLQQAAVELETCLRSDQRQNEQDVAHAAAALREAAEQCGQLIPPALDELLALSSR